MLVHLRRFILNFKSKFERDTYLKLSIYKQHTRRYSSPRTTTQRCHSMKKHYYYYSTLTLQPNVLDETTNSSSDSFIIDSKWVRNIAIIAHVDHGKTTLVDCLLEQSGCLVPSLCGGNSTTTSSTERVMDSNDLEKERGITILSKATSIQYGPYRVNIMDTPGHSDFGGEVERVLSMVDGVLLVVDASEGPMAQTKFVLHKALSRGLATVVVLNKVDRIESARPDNVDSELLDLFMTLGANEKQMNYKLIYCSAKEGWARDTNPLPLLKEGSNNNGAFKQDWNIHPIFDAIIKYIPYPGANLSENPRSRPFSMLINNLESNSYLGKCYLGKIEYGTIHIGDKIKGITPDGKETEEGRVSKLFIRRGLRQLSVNEAAAGDIVTLAGLSNCSINMTICSLDVTEALPVVTIDPPTLSMIFSINNSPLSNKEGKAVTSQLLLDRLRKEVETNVALTISSCDDANDAFEVFGRGELQLGILIETLRREGMELAVSPPKVIYKYAADDYLKKRPHEPIEEVILDISEEYSGIVIEKLTKRKGILIKMTDAKSHSDKCRLVFHMPTRGLLGYQTEFKNDTHGTGLLNHSFLGYEDHKGKLDTTRKGALISMTEGICTAYALNELEARGKLFVSPGTSVYSGMIIGEHSRVGDLEVNPVRTKQVTNIRTVNKDEAIRLTPPRLLSLEESIAYVAEDEMIEVTPKNLRLRKKLLDPVERKNKNKSK